MIKCYVCYHEDHEDNSYCPDCNSDVACIKLSNDARSALKRISKDGYFQTTGIQFDDHWIIPIERIDVAKINKFMEKEGIYDYSEVVKKLVDFAASEISKIKK